MLFENYTQLVYSYPQVYAYLAEKAHGSGWSPQSC